MKTRTGSGSKYLLLVLRILNWSSVLKWLIFAGDILNAPKSPQHYLWPFLAAFTFLFLTRVIDFPCVWALPKNNQSKRKHPFVRTNRKCSNGSRLLKNNKENVCVFHLYVQILGPFREVNLTPLSPPSPIQLITVLRLLRSQHHFVLPWLLSRKHKLSTTISFAKYFCCSIWNTWLLLRERG